MTAVDVASVVLKSRKGTEYSLNRMLVGLNLQRQNPNKNNIEDELLLHVCQVYIAVIAQSGQHTVSQYTLS